MEKYSLYILFLLLSFGLGLYANDIDTLKQAPSTSINESCKGFVLVNGFSFKASSTKSLIFRINTNACTAEETPTKISSNHNYIVSITPLGKTQSIDYVDGKITVDRRLEGDIDVLTEIQYFDGLGRPIQTVQRQVTPLKNDLVTYQEYDAFGRSSRTWLPAVLKGDGAFQSLIDIKKDQTIYNNDARPFNEPIYEASPLNRIEKQYGAGNEWREKLIESKYLTNLSVGDPQLICALFSCDNDKVKRSGNYATGELYITKLKDEEGNISYEFKNKLGQIVLNRQVEDDKNHDTYHVYDDLGNKRFVLPPLASSAFSQNGAWDQSNENFKNYVYFYKYNNRNLCIEKKIPGAEKNMYVYDNADRLIFSQDGVQRSDSEWTYYIPDRFGRIVLTGICKNTDISNANYQNKIVTASFRRDIGTNFGYTISGLVSPLTSNNVLTANYYDNYDFLNTQGFPNWIFENKTGYDKQYTGTNGYESKGLLTGSAIGILDQANQYNRSVVYYDSKGNVIQTKSTNHLGGTDAEYFALTFTGQPKIKLRTHTVNNRTITEEYSYTYDHAGRLEITKHKLGNSNSIVLAHNKYDELGRLNSIQSNGQEKLQTIYTYNIRSWFKSISNHHFWEKLEFLANGNIQKQEWGQAGNVRKYTFGYDNLSRIKSATYTKSQGDDSNYAASYAYDMHGNINLISRQGLSQNGYVEVDKLTLTYKGNQLTNVIDKGIDVKITSSSDFKDNNKTDNKTVVEYTYNANGAMDSDLNKGISGIKYNNLNLPKEMAINHTSARAKNYYTYNAVGTKLRTIHKYDPKLQAVTVVGSTAGDGLLTESITTDYVEKTIYKNGVLTTILTDNGYIDVENNKNIYYFYIKDHLGNNRIVADQNASVIQSNQYYPFGMLFAESTNQDKQSFKYNGKELDKLHGLNQYDYSARYYDPAISRFTTIDPLAEKKPWLTPYHYCSNNPISRVDPDGMLDISRLVNGSHYGIIAVFPETRDRQLEDDYKAANEAGIATMQVLSIDDFALGMSKMSSNNITTEGYALNSHGGPGYFYIGDISTYNKVTDKPVNDFQDISVLKEGLSEKFVFIGSCNLTQNEDERGLKTATRFSTITNSTVVSSDHLLPTKFKYDGSDYLDHPFSPIQLELMPSRRTQITNSYHLTKPGEKPTPIFNFTIDKNGKPSWRATFDDEVQPK